MAISLIRLLSSISHFSVLQIFLSLSALVVGFLAFTYISTTIQFQRANARAESDPNPSTPRVPATIPYTLPWLGVSLQFLDEQHGRFWENLREKLGQNHELCTILLGGMTTYILNARVENLFKVSKAVNRDRFDREVMVKGFGCSLTDFEKFQKHAREPVEVGSSKQKVPVQHLLFHEHLLAPAAVNALTAKFIETFEERLDSFGKEGEWTSVDLCTWLRDNMFFASTTAFLGSKVLEIYPDLAEDFWKLDSNILNLVYGVPKIIAPEGHGALKRLMDAGEEWHRQAAHNVDIDEVTDLDWEPWYGSKLIRARQKMYVKAKMSPRGTFSPDLGFLFGLSSNAIPATTWMLLHLLTSKDTTLLPAILAEIKTSVLPNGSISIPALTSCPLLLSIYTEVLRLYVDLLVTREIHSTFVLPPNHLLKKGGIVMAPTYLSHHDPVFWRTYNTRSDSFCSSPPSAFDPYRFLHPPPDREKSKAPVFSTSGTAGKLFPYGGGPHMCPGRTFAKQEILAGVAIVLLGFEIEAEGKGPKIPGVKKAYAGAGVVGFDGGLNVRIRRKYKG